MVGHTGDCRVVLSEKGGKKIYGEVIRVRGRERALK